MRSNRTFLLVVATMVYLTAPALAQSVPTVMNYQGRLTDNSPQQIPIDVALPMEFRIYRSLVGDVDLLWSEPWASVSVNDGIFSVLLGSNGFPIPAVVFTSGTTRYLEVIVDGETLTPRQQLGSVGWANQAEKSADSDSLNGLGSASWQRRVTDSCAAGSSIRAIGATGTVTCEPDSGITTETDPQVGSLASNQVARWTGTSLNGGALWDTGGAVGINDSSPGTTLEVNGITTIRNGWLYMPGTGNTSGLFIRNTSDTSQWFLGRSTSTDLRIYDYVSGTYVWKMVGGGGLFIDDLRLTVQEVSDSVGATTTNLSPDCPAGTYRTGGGCDCSGGSLEKSSPFGSDGWFCECSTATTVRAYAVCVNSTAP